MLVAADGCWRVLGAGCWVLGDGRWVSQEIENRKRSPFSCFAMRLLASLATLASLVSISQASVR